MKAWRGRFEPRRLGALALLLSACIHPPAVPPAVVPPATAAFPAVTPAQMEVVAVAEPAPAPLPERFTLAVNGAELRDVLMLLAKDASFSLVLDPGVGGRVSVDLKRTTLPEALDALLAPLHLAYQLDGDRVHVYQPGVVTRAFHLDYLNAKRDGHSTLTISSGGGGGGESGGGSSSSSSGSGGSSSQSQASTEITRQVSTDVWAAVELGLTSLVGANTEGSRAQVVVNRDAGTVLVTADASLMDRVAAYLQAVEGAMGRQVMIEAKIVEVELNDAHRLGVNWAAVASASGGFTGSLTGGAADLMAKSPIFAQQLGGGETAFRVGATSHDLAVVLDAIATQGQVRVVSSPRVAALNNQPAVIKVAQEQTFFSLDRQTNTEAGVQQDTFTVDKEKYTIGVVLDIVPRIGADGTITMGVHPSVTDFAGEDVFPPGAKGAGILANAPILKVRELDTVVRLNDRETLVIAGLIRQEDRDEVEQVPGLGDLPFVGALFRHTRQVKAGSELVIFLTPHLVHGGEDFAADFPLSQRTPTYHLGGEAGRFGYAAEQEPPWRGIQ